MEHEITRGLERAGILPLGRRRSQGCNVNLKSRRDHRREELAALRQRLDEVVIEPSPIMETVQRVAVDRFSGRAASSIPKRLIIISDMLEHTAAYSHYSGDLSFERFRLSDTYHKVRTDLGGAEVIIKYVHRLRPGHSSTREHIEFWREWARDSNGGRFQADRLQGAG